MKNRDLKNRVNRVIARGEQSGHSHIITGECTIEEGANNAVIVHAGKDCAIRHLLEKPFVDEGLEVWTKEHGDILLKEGESYEIVQQNEFNPYLKAMQKVSD